MRAITLESSSSMMEEILCHLLLDLTLCLANDRYLIHASCFKTIYEIIATPILWEPKKVKYSQP